MPFVWKILRIIGLYIACFFGCVIVAATALSSLPDALEALFALLAPIALVWWFEKRRAAKFSEQANLESQSSRPLVGQATELGAAKSYQPKQDNAELIRAGQQARAELEAAAERRSAEKLARQSLSNQFLDQHSQPKKPNENAPTRSQGWVTKGQSVTIAGRTIDGMLYVGKPPRIGSSYHGEVCRAYIDPSLSVAHVGTDKNGDNMPYWPGYSSIPAVCRATYLDWLAGGRQDRTINPGYMFLFFYGLERRFLVDDAPESEKRDILVEVRRLKELFSTNHSAQRYLGEFIEVASIILDDTDFKKPIYKNWGWELPLSLKVTLGGAIANDMPINADWLLSWFMCHNEKRLRTPATRCENEFVSLFKHKFAIRFPSDLKLSKPRKHLEYSYTAASGEFGGNIPISANGKPILDISGLRKPVEIAQEIADEAMDELDKFSRYLGRNIDGRGTIEAQALLPAQLWSLFPSGELDELKAWAQEQVVAGGLVPAIEVISRLEGAPPEKLGKRNLTGAADSLARIGFGMAPDPRFSLRGPKIDEPVVIFELGDTVQQLEDVSEAYRSQLFELALATFVAHADRKIVEAERRALRDKVEATSGLTDLERKRLHANLEWYLNVPPDMSLLRSKLKDADAEHHLALRAAVVAIAHADGVIQSDEVASIEKVYKALGLDSGLVYADLHAGDVADAPVRAKAAEAEAPGEQIPVEPKAKVASLDPARIAAIRNDTERVSSVLSEIFSTDGDERDATTESNALPSALAGLDPKHALLVVQIIQRNHWSEEEFGEIAGQHGLMPSGALEVINEWAFERFDEALLDEYDGYDISPDVSDALQAQIAKGD